MEKVTVILVTSTPVGDGAPCLPTIRSVEDQSWPNDLYIVINDDGYDLTQMLRLGAQHADTRLVAIIEEGDVWPGDMLAKLVENYSKDPSRHGFQINVADDDGTVSSRGVVAEKEHILQAVEPVRLTP